MTTPAEPPARTLPWTAVPAVVVLVACLALTVVVVLKSTRPDVAALRARAEAAVAADDTKTAILDYQHLLAVEPGEPRHAVGLARTLDAAGRRREAFAVLGVIAPAGGGGFAPAHLLAAEWIIEARMTGTTLDAAALQAVTTHLDAAAADPTLQRRVAELRVIVSKL